MNYTAVIVDDEKLARNIIIEYLDKHPEINVIAQCNNGDEAVRIINTIHPDIVFLDIQMPGRCGFEVLEKLDKTPIIIFSTAYSEFAIKAFEVNAIDYLLKPYSQKRFDKAIENIKKQNSEMQEKITRLLGFLSESQKADFPKQIFVKKKDRIIPLKLSQIEYINGENDYVRIHSSSETYLADQTLKGLDVMLDPRLFIRIHRSYIVNFKFIKEIQKTFKGNYSVHMISGVRLPVGRTYQKKLKTHFI